MHDDVMAEALRQARDLQQKITEAVVKGQEQAKPYLEQTMKQADELRETLILQARRSADLTHEQTNKALDDLNAAMKAGAEAMRSQSEAAKPFLDQFFQQARHAADQITKTFSK